MWGFIFMSCHLGRYFLKALELSGLLELLKFVFYFFKHWKYRPHHFYLKSFLPDSYNYWGYLTPKNSYLLFYHCFHLTLSRLTIVSIPTSRHILQENVPVITVVRRQWSCLEFYKWKVVRQTSQQQRKKMVQMSGASTRLKHHQFHAGEEWLFHLISYNLEKE